MDSEPHQPHTLCTKCNIYVRTANYLVHQNRCKGPVSYSESRSPSIQSSSSRMNLRSNSRRQPTQFDQQRIPCHFCGYPQTLVQLDTHPNTCEHRQQQCPRCHNKFPRSLMDQHRFVCPGNRQNQQQDHQSQEQYQSIFQPRRMFPHHQQLHFHRNRPDRIFQLMMNSISSPMMRRRPSNPMRDRTGQRVILIHDLGELIRMLAGGHLGEERGLKKQDISNFPTSKFNSKQKQEGDQEMCIICYCNFQEDQSYMKLPCKHIFHPECIGTWLQKNPTCPVCKRNLGKKQQQSQPEQDYSSRRQPPTIFQFFRSF